MRFFSELMAESLYGEQGYYRALRVGKEGDFYTSVSVGKLFGYTIGFSIVSSFKQHAFPCSVVEIGAERGYLMGDIVEYCLQYAPEVAEAIEFFVIEPLEELRGLQLEYFSKKGIQDHIRILDHYPTFKAPLFVANELFDAIPCDVVYGDKVAVFDGERLEFVTPSESGDSKRAEELLEIARKFGISKGEISLQTTAFLQDVLQNQTNWGFLTFDYGDDYFRDEFSLRFYKEHQPFCLDDFLKDPLSFVGVADMTYDVAFNYLDSLFLKHNAKRYGFYRQNRALMYLGVGNVFETLTKELSPGSKDYIHLSSQLKTLITPSLLGDRFKCALYGTNRLLEHFFQNSF